VLASATVAVAVQLLLWLLLWQVLLGLLPGLTFVVALNYGYCCGGCSMLGANWVCCSQALVMHRPGPSTERGRRLRCCKLLYLTQQ
jgi:hypothetical protein